MKGKVQKYGLALPEPAHLTAARSRVRFRGMRTSLQVVAALLALGVAAFWFFAGSNFGWTKTSVAEKFKDPVTEIEVDRYAKRFVPGVDFLGAGLVTAGALVGTSFFFRKKTAQN